jgi:hypothetical protein
MDPYQLRPATPQDLETLLHHRRRMFEDMGFDDPAALEAMLASSTPLLRRGLMDGTYRGWLVEASGGGASSRGSASSSWSSSPIPSTRCRVGPGWSTCSRSLSIAVTDWLGG